MKIPDPKSRRTFLKNLSALSTLPLISFDTLSSLTAADRKKNGGLIPVMITPFKKDQSIDWSVFDQLTDFYDAAGAAGYFANCLSSEMYLLSPEERLAVTERVIKRFDGKKRVVSTGSFGETMREKSEFVKKLANLGTDAVILITSHFASKTDSDQTLIKNLEEIMALTDNIPLGTYESPNPYKRVLSPEVYSLIAQSKRFTYHKDTSEDIQGITNKLRIGKGSKLKLYNAHTASAVASIRAGGAGMSPISANFYPEIIDWVCRNANSKSQKDNADWIQSELVATEPLISKGYPMSSKYFLKKRGLPMELVTRVVRKPLTTEQLTVLDGVHDRFLGWCQRLKIKPVKM